MSGIIFLDHTVQDNEHLFQFYTIYAPDLQFAVCVVQIGPVLVHPAVASGHDTLFVPWHHSQPSNQPVKHLKFTITPNQEKISYLIHQGISCTPWTPTFSSKGTNSQDVSYTYHMHAFIYSVLTVNTKTLYYTQHANPASNVIKTGVLTAHFLSITVFQDVTMCHLMNGHCHFSGTMTLQDGQSVAAA